MEMNKIGLIWERN